MPELTRPAALAELKDLRFSIATHKDQEEWKLFCVRGTAKFNTALRVPGVASLDGIIRGTVKGRRDSPIDLHFFGGSDLFLGVRWEDRDWEWPFVLSAVVARRDLDGVEDAGKGDELWADVELRAGENSLAYNLVATGSTNKWRGKI